MSERDPGLDRPLEESPEMTSAAADESTLPQLRTGGGGDANNPRFLAPDDVPGDFPPTEELIGDSQGGGVPGSDETRTGAEQPWDPEDLVVAWGQDPTPANVERARRVLAEEGPAAVEKTVP
ncbi:hypothetical protein OG792_27855 [Micromonospora sp. NBC_01699]|uniref:hypothetical protein n=1 Tax=Micromonospora sp. NBC_01699 TaxID=2975984 RepID=UPI002E2D9945|nr:hypothetical protein [Micromonospora sp. NBC_01699]